MLQIGEPYVSDSQASALYQCFDENGEAVLDDEIQCVTVGIREKGEEDSSDEEDDGK